MSSELEGVGAAPGIAIGPAFVYHAGSAGHVSAPGDAQLALQQLAAAQRAAAQRFSLLAERERRAGFAQEAGIFDFQAYLAEDPDLTERIQRLITGQGRPLDEALRVSIAELCDQLRQSDNPVLRERTADLEAVEHELRRILSHSSMPDVPAGAILVAADLTPADTVELHQRVAGVVLAGAGPSSHSVILARSRGIPMVVGVGSHILGVANRTLVVVDGDRTRVVIDPGAEQLAYYARLQQEITRHAAQHSRNRGDHGRLADGLPVALLANVASIADARAAQQFGAQGIGLVRTEILFYGADGRRSDAPTEAEQLAFYREIIAAMPGLPITVRTADIGGDKPVSYLGAVPEANPFLGERGIRWCMRHPELLHAQLRALLQAAVYGDVRVMVPMIATPDDLAWARRALQQARASLEADRLALRADVPFGAMIETPAAAVTIDLLAEQADFFSIGTNDLAQYTLAADRGMAGLAQRYRQNAAGVLRLVASATQAAQRAGRPISVCGDLAGVPDAAEILVGLGITTLSMAAPLIPLVKAHLAGRTQADARLAATAAGISE